MMENTIYIKCNNNYYSLYSNKDIKKGDVIMAIKDIIYQTIPTKYSVQIDTNKHIEVPKGIEAYKSETYFWKYLNHNCEPNCFFNVDSMVLIALRDIKKDEELNFDYNTTEYDMSSPFKCDCKSVNCYGTIKGYKYLSVKQKAALKPYIAKHLNIIDKEFIEK